MSQPRPAPADPVQIAGRYDVVQKLGAGAFGTVFKAKDKLLGRMVAIKTIRLEGLAAQGAGLEELLKRFNVEAMVSAQLKHPNIVTIYDVGNSDGMTYLAMEFIDGVGLDRLIATQGRLPVERAALIAAQVADALDFAHRNNVVHRDIKPANIMIEPGDRVKVTDFGIAKATDSGEHLTVTGSLLGTPSYMSPEQAKGAALDGRSDLFSTGCVLYEMLVGRKAFRGDSITGLIFKIITEEPTPITEVEPLIPDAMVKIVQKALSKPLESRYQTGRALADELLALTRGGSWPTMRQTETPTAAVAAGTAMPTVVTAGTQPGSTPTVATTPTVGSTQPPAAPTRVSPPPPARAASVLPTPTPAPLRSGSNGLLLVGGAAVLLLLMGLAAVGWYVFGRTGDKPATAEVVPTAAPPAGTAAPPTPGSVATDPPITPGPTAADTPSTTVPAATLPPTTARTPAAELAATAKPAAASSAAAEAGSASDHYAYLDDEDAAPTDGVAAGERLAGAYGNNRGSRMGASTRLKRRPKSPENLRLPAERAAVATLRHLIHAEMAFHKREGRYGTLADLVNARFARLDVKPSTKGFERNGYRFELMVKDDGFDVVAMPQIPGPRPFHGDDSEFILVGVD